ncbi:urea transporter [Enhygromyxa salina]|uniref:Urea transporter n=1 Tax=Enhygromyxa salina TaxID=215803 RepID=A0A2S9YTK2_9BACT|nr:urea transporter [Enhygromyxa salina]PRQ08369.1 Urea transporter [Enhygromyxa salina]
MSEPAPLHELLARVVAPVAAPPPAAWRFPLGTMQALNQRLAERPSLNFVNATLRGIGQVIFANNPVSGLIILVAMFVQSPWLGLMSLVGVISATAMAMAMRLAPDAIQNGVFGLNGLLVGAAMGFAGRAGNGPWNPVWIAAAVLLSALATVVMHTLGTWFVTRLKAAPLGVAFNAVMLVFFLVVVFVPQTLFDLGPSPAPFPAESIDGLRLARSLPAGLGQVFFSDGVIPLLLIVVAVGICTPIGLVVALLGCAISLVAGLSLGARPGEMYLGLWGYNAVLSATAIGGVFYAPNWRSITLGSICAFLASAGSIVLARWLAPLPVLSIPFTIVTVGCFWVVRRTIPSLVPVALHAVASPEEHRQRHAVASEVISQFRRALTAASRHEQRVSLFDQAPSVEKHELRRVFDAIDHDHSGELSPAEIEGHLASAGISGAELALMLECLDVDRDGLISFEEFGELLLRHRRLMSRYDQFFTYFMPIDADGDDVISIDEMNNAMRSVGERPLSSAETEQLQRRAQGQPLTWDRFIQVLLLT